jgi:hypothetical protein
LEFDTADLSSQPQHCPLEGGAGSFSRGSTRRACELIEGELSVESSPDERLIILPESTESCSKAASLVGDDRGLAGVGPGIGRIERLRRPEPAAPKATDFVDDTVNDRLSQVRLDRRRRSKVTFGEMREHAGRGVLDEVFGIAVRACSARELAVSPCGDSRQDLGECLA